jgi:hypothetical protein
MRTWRRHCEPKAKQSRNNGVDPDYFVPYAPRNSEKPSFLSCVTLNVRHLRARHVLHADETFFTKRTRTYGRIARLRIILPYIEQMSGEAHSYESREEIAPGRAAARC